jgi:hypothetical protein
MRKRNVENMALHKKMIGLDIPRLSKAGWLRQ